jgi:hypothetical protein
MAASEDLATGYGAATPPGDNLLNDFVRENAGSFAAFARARGDRVARIEGVATLMDSGSPVPFSNRAVLERPAGDVSTVLDHVRPFYDAVGDAPFLLDSAWPTPDLAPLGFQLMGHPPLMLRAAGVALPDPPPELRIVRVDDEQRAYDYEYVLIYGYPAPPLQPMTDVTIMTPRALDAPGWQHFVGYVDDDPVATGSGFAGDRLVRVENIATLEHVRGRGYGSAMTAAAISIDPALPSALIASDLGRPVYERLGFAALVRFTYWLGFRSSTT